MAVKILGVKFGKSKRKTEDAQPMTQARLKQEINLKALRALNSIFERQPDLLAEYAFENILHKKMPSLGEQNLQEELKKDPALRRKYAEMEMQKKGMEITDPFTQFSTQFKQMMMMAELIKGNGGSNGAVDKLIDAVSGLGVAFLEGGGGEAIAQGMMGDRESRNGHRPRGRASIIDATDEQKSLSSRESNNNEHTENQSQNNSPSDSEEEESHTLSDSLGVMINNFIVMINYCIDGHDTYTPKYIAEYVLYRLNEIYANAIQVAEQTGEDDPVMENLIMINDVIRRSPKEINNMLTFLGLRDKKMMPLIKKVKTEEGQAILAKICEERDVILKEVETRHE